MGNRRNIYSKYRILKISSSYGIWRATGIFFCVNKIKKKEVLILIIHFHLERSLL